MTVQDLKLGTTDLLEEHQVRQLGAVGLRVVSRLPGGGYRVRGESDATAATLLGLDFVDTVSPYEPVDKLDPALADAIVLAERDGADGNPGDAAVSVLVSLDQHVDPALTTEGLASLGDIVGNTSRRVLLRLPADRIRDMAALPGVLHAEPAPDP
jgi:hypothetical protein